MFGGRAKVGGGEMLGRGEAGDHKVTQIIIITHGGLFCFALKCDHDDSWNY